MHTSVALIDRECVRCILQSYAALAYAPPKALLVLLRQQLQPQVSEVDPSQLSAALWCFSLFKDLAPELWNAAMGVLSQPHVTSSIQTAALAQLYQVHNGHAYLLLYG